MNVFDTSVLIAHLRGNHEARLLLEESIGADQAFCSVLSIVEIEGGMRSGERSKIANMFALLRPVAVSEVIARRAGEFARSYRRSHTGIDVVDYVIAATAETLGADLKTLNVKRFPMLKGLRPAF